MKEISISVTYDIKDSIYSGAMFQISDARDNHVPDKMEVTEIHYEKEWISGKTRITFKGIKK